MPLRFRAPWIPRYTGRTPAPARAPAVAGRPRGAVGLGGIDLTPTGNPGVDLVKAINATMQQNRQNAIANQILNMQNPPRAGLVAPGVSPTTGQPNVIPAGLSTTGSAPATGGLGELQMRQQIEQQNLADALQRARVAHMISLTAPRGPTGAGSAAQWRANLGAQPVAQPAAQPSGRGGRGGGKPAAYVAGSGDVQNDPSTDNFGQIRTDFDAQHGAGSFNAFTKNMGNLMDDGKGNLVVGKSAPDPNDPSKTIQVPATDKNGLPLFSIPKTDAPFWTNRYNAARIRAGQGYAGTLPDGVNPNSGQPSGSQINPIAVGDNLGLRSLPYNTWMQMPDGSVRQKLPQAVSPQGQQGQPAAQPAASSQPEGAAEQEGAEQQLESEEAGSEGESSGSASRGAAGGSPTSQLAGAVGGGISPMANPQMNLLMSGFQAPSATPPSYAGAPAPDTGQIASANVSPTGAAQSYLQSLGLGAGAGQLYPAGDLWG